jgi:hypothetical protein
MLSLDMRAGQGVRVISAVDSVVRQPALYISQYRAFLLLTRKEAKREGSEWYDTFHWMLPVVLLRPRGSEEESR